MNTLILYVCAITYFSTFSRNSFKLLLASRFCILFNVRLIGLMSKSKIMLFLYLLHTANKMKNVEVTIV